MLSARLRAVIPSLGSILILGSSVTASADEPKPIPRPVAGDLKRLTAALDLFAEDARRTRLATALTGLGIGSALVPAGSVLLTRTDGVSQALVIGMIVGGSAQLISVPLSFIPTKMDDIREQLRERVAANADGQATVHAIETEWETAAAAGRSKRRYVGATLSILGLLSLTGGLAALLADEGLFGMSRKTQYIVGGVMMGIGTPVTTIGARFLIEWSPEERAWEAYRTMKPTDASLKARLNAPSIALVPTQGGVLAFATLAL
jgi:hypothetical protein